MTVCPICRDHPGVLRGPGPMGTTVPCWACRRGRTRAARACWVLACLVAAGAAGSSWGLPW